MQYVARRELIFGLHIHVAVDDPEKAIQVVNGLLAHISLAPRAVGVVALLAWRGDRPRVEQADGLRGFPTLRPAAALQGLRGLRRGRRPAREDGLHRRLHAHLVGHPPASAARDDRDPNLRRGDSSRGRGRAGGVLPGARQALLRAIRARRRDSLLPPDPDDREQVARRSLRARSAGDGPRNRPAKPRPRRPARPAPPEGHRAPRARAGLGASARRHPRDPRPAATAPTASSASSTRTETSSRSCARSPTRQRPPRFRPSARATRSRPRRRSCAGRRWRRTRRPPAVKPTPSTRSQHSGRAADDAVGGVQSQSPCALTNASMRPFGDDRGARADPVQVVARRHRPEARGGRDVERVEVDRRHAPGERAREIEATLIRGQRRAQLRRHA